MTERIHIMDLRNARQAIIQAAQIHGITEKEAVKEIGEAIGIAIGDAISRNDHAMLDLWKEIPCEGDYPNAYELVAFLCEKLGLE